MDEVDGVWSPRHQRTRTGGADPTRGSGPPVSSGSSMRRRYAGWSGARRNIHHHRAMKNKSKFSALSKITDLVHIEAFLTPLPPCRQFDVIVTSWAYALTRLGNPLGCVHTILMPPKACLNGYLVALHLAAQFCI